MIDALVYLIILLVVGGLLWYLVTLLPLSPVVKQIIQVLGILVLVLLLIAMLFGGIDTPALLRRP